MRDAHPRHQIARGHGELTVNTQEDNHASLAVYTRLGFRPTGVRLPVYELRW